MLIADSRIFSAFLFVRAFYFFGEMMSIILLLSFWNALITQKHKEERSNAFTFKSKSRKYQRQSLKTGIITICCFTEK
jgi:predicted membrane protein